MTQQPEDTLQASASQGPHVAETDTTLGAAPRHTFSAWRVARAMPGATPQQLDSAIQAALPPRETHPSARPDTLEIPGLRGKDPYAGLDSLPQCYRMGYFLGDSLLHPEVRVGQTGYSGTPVPYKLWRDDWVTLPLLLCFVVMTSVLRGARGRAGQQLKDFFFPPRGSRPADDAESGGGEGTALVVTLLLCLMGGLWTFVYAQDRLSLFLGQLSPYTLIGLYVALWAAYFAARNALCGFVNWVFFEKQEIVQWTRAYRLLLTGECILLFPVTLTAVYFDIPFDTALWALLAVAGAAKLLLLYKTYAIFLNNLYGALHLITYLCALELTPLLVLLKALVGVTDYLIVKF